MLSNISPELSEEICDHFKELVHLKATKQSYHTLPQVFQYNLHHYTPLFLGEIQIPKTLKSVYK